MVIKKRQKRKNLFLPKIFKFFSVLLILIILFFLINSNLQLYKKRILLSDQIGELSQKIKNLEKENQVIKDKISKSKSKEYLEEIAFERLNLKPKGAEVGVIILPQKEVSQQEVFSEEKKDFWEKFLETVKNFLMQ